jgi:hypothetical protein
MIQSKCRKDPFNPMSVHFASPLFFLLWQKNAALFGAAYQKSDKLFCLQNVYDLAAVKAVIIFYGIIPRIDGRIDKACGIQILHVDLAANKGKLCFAEGDCISFKIGSQPRLCDLIAIPPRLGSANAISLSHAVLQNGCGKIRLSLKEFVGIALGTDDGTEHVFVPKNTHRTPRCGHGVKGFGGSRRKEKHFLSDGGEGIENFGIRVVNKHKIPPYESVGSGAPKRQASRIVPLLEKEKQQRKQKQPENTAELHSDVNTEQGRKSR